jgi:hypothetical protein
MEQTLNVLRKMQLDENELVRLMAALTIFETRSDQE